MFKLSVIGIGTALIATLVTLPLTAQETTPASATSPASRIQWADDVITAFKVRDVKASVRWYRDVLGCELALDLSKIGWCELTTPIDGALIGLGQPEPGKEPEPSGGASFSFGVRDVEAARRVLEAKGVETELIEIPEVVKLLEFCDPDGNRLMFHQPIKGS